MKLRKIQVIQKFIVGSTKDDKGGGKYFKIVVHQSFLYTYIYYPFVKLGNSTKETMRKLKCRSKKEKTELSY